MFSVVERLFMIPEMIFKFHMSQENIMTIYNILTIYISEKYFAFFTEALFVSWKFTYKTFN